MTIGNLIDGASILRQYFEGNDGFHVGAEHDQIFIYATHRPVSKEHVLQLFGMAWFQPDAEGSAHDFEDDDEDGKFSAYDPEERWGAFT